MCVLCLATWLPGFLEHQPRLPTHVACIQVLAVPAQLEDLDAGATHGSRQLCRARISGRLWSPSWLSLPRPVPGQQAHRQGPKSSSSAVIPRRQECFVGLFPKVHILTP